MDGEPDESSGLMASVHECPKCGASVLLVDAGYVPRPTAPRELPRRKGARA